MTVFVKNDLRLEEGCVLVAMRALLDRRGLGKGRRRGDPARLYQEYQ
jgi:hypothetical protein